MSSTTGATAVTPAERTGARTDEAAALIGGARERIDTLDDRIIGLVQERMAVSAVIQEARITSGGRMGQPLPRDGRARPLQGRAGQAGHRAGHDAPGAVPRPGVRPGLVWDLAGCETW